MLQMENKLDDIHGNNSWDNIKFILRIFGNARKVKKWPEWYGVTQILKMGAVVFITHNSM